MEQRTDFIRIGSDCLELLRLAAERRAAIERQAAQSAERIRDRMDAERSSDTSHMTKGKAGL